MSNRPEADDYGELRRLLQKRASASMDAMVEELGRLDGRLLSDGAVVAAAALLLDKRLDEISGILREIEVNTNPVRE